MVSFLLAIQYVRDKIKRICMIWIGYPFTIRLCDAMCHSLHLDKDSLGFDLVKIFCFSMTKEQQSLKKLVMSNQTKVPCLAHIVSTCNCGSRMENEEKIP